MRHTFSSLLVDLKMGFVTIPASLESLQFKVPFAQIVLIQKKQQHLIQLKIKIQNKEENAAWILVYMSVCKKL